MQHYSVDLSSGINESFFKDLEKLAGEKLVARKRLTEITIELFQNIQRYSVSVNSARLVIEKRETDYSIIAINSVDGETAKTLQQKINDINALDHTQLKAQHTKALREAVLSNTHGAGLGLYRIALRSASALIGSFKPIDQHNFLFSLNVSLTI